VKLSRPERAFVLFAGLKGAVPILLGGFILTAHVSDPARLYGIVVVVVTFSVLVQGSLVPAVAGLLRLPMRTVEPSPWSLGVRLRDEPDGARRLVVASGSRADGHTIAELTSLASSLWVCFVVRDGSLLATRLDLRLAAGDEVVVLAAANVHDDLAATFEQPAPG
jgi:potassium/hydrogen antiporter